MNCLFRPNAARAREIDRRVRDALADSLKSVFDACRGHLIAAPSAQASLLTALRSYPVAPAVFALYTELVEAVFAGQNDTAQHLLDMLLSPVLSNEATPRVVTLEEASLGNEIPTLYARTVDDDAGISVRIDAVDTEELARGTELCHAAGALLRAAAPDLQREINTIGHELVLVRNADDAAGGTTFDGAATFYLWGAVVLNSSRQSSRTALATALAHEAGHAYLLGATLGAPLVDNDPRQRFRSPLRLDPRPMDGLVHASFVLARMLWCQDRMLDSGLLSAAEQSEVRNARVSNHRMFVDSTPVIDSQARFTGDGGNLWTAARDWVTNGCLA